MFRFIALLSALLLTVGLASPAQAGTVTFTDSQGISYSADDAQQGAGATVTGYNRNVGGSVVNIPATVTIGSTEYAVKTIGDLALFDKQLTSVTIPTSVTSVNEGAFANNQLTTVIVPDGVTTVGDFAFASNQLTQLTIGDSVITIGRNAFVSNQLTNVAIGDSVTTIDQGAFSYNQLTSVAIGDSVTTIAWGAFSDNQLTSVTIPSAVTTIGFAAFYGNQLTSVTIGDSVTSIGANAFDGSSNLTAVKLLGPAPSVWAARMWWGGPDEESFDTASGALVLSYPAEFGEPATPGGYTTPTWKGYNTSVTAVAPTITGDATASGTKGAAFSYTPTVTGTPDPAVTVTGDLPAGLELSSTTGEITGTPTQTGSFPVVLKAANSAGSDTLDVTITIDSEPTISGDATASGTKGTAFSYTPTVTGSPDQR